MYATEVVWSQMLDDGKKHLRSTVECFETEQEAHVFLDETEDRLKANGWTMKIGKIYEVSRVEA